MVFTISKKSLFDVWVQNPKSCKFEAMLTLVLEQMQSETIREPALNNIKVRIRSFSQKIEQKWEKVARHRERFLQNYSSWLQENITFPDQFESEANESTSRGRPVKEFSACGSKAKQLKIKNLMLSTSKEELSMATEMTLRKEGKRDSAAIIKELSVASPKRGTAIKKARMSQLKISHILSADQALSLIVDTNLSTRQYMQVRQRAIDVNSKLYPPYYKVKRAKQLCYPSEITISEISAEVTLQSLIDHTITRLSQCESVMQVFSVLELSSAKIIIKWGCDGAEQKRYKQTFSEEYFTDETLFSISMVPIQMYSGTDTSKTIIWQNPAPSSTRYCRPIKLFFAKETVDLITTEVAEIENQIKTLSPTKINFNGKEITVKADLIFCMVDGKVCNAVSSCTSTQTCYLCGAKPSEMNCVNIIKNKQVNKAYLSFGLSPLHSWIRLLECILHISYRLEIKSWQVRGVENKEKVSKKKKHVQDSFKSELGLLIDMPKQQTGNTNDGNTARRFFRNPEKSAEITGVSLELIKRFGVILECVNSYSQINLDKFEIYVRETRDLYLKEYSWYLMPVTLHKILFHGRDIISTSILPIGQLSEEAQEARNKHSRQYRERFTRKTSRIDTNTDLLNRLLVTSDPYIASLRSSPKTKREKMNPEVLNLLEPTMSEIRPEEDSSEVDTSKESSEEFSDSE